MASSCLALLVLPPPPASVHPRSLSLSPSPLPTPRQPAQRLVFHSQFPRPSPVWGRGQSPGTTHQSLCVRAEYRENGRGGGGSGGGGFLAGFLVGGAICGALAFAFAPQLSKTLLGENDDGTPRKLPKWLGEDDSLEATRRKMNEKLAELNRAIDRASADILGEEEGETEAEAEERGRKTVDNRAMQSIDAI